MKEENKQKYKSFLYFLESVLGNNYEIALHVKEGEQFYIEEIVNGHVSNRDTSSPITDLGLKFYRDKLYLNEDFITNYDVKTPDAKPIQGSTFFLKDENGELEGMICINHDYSDYQIITDSIQNLTSAMGSMDLLGKSSKESANRNNEDTNGEGERAVEVLSNSISDTIGAFINPALLDQVDLNTDMKIKIISELDEQGIFNIKGSVAQVASKLNISESSVYRYIKMVEKNSS